jgi:hypothetical protein
MHRHHIALFCEPDSLISIPNFDFRKVDHLRYDLEHKEPTGQELVRIIQDAQDLLDGMGIDIKPVWDAQDDDWLRRYRLLEAIRSFYGSNIHPRIWSIFDLAFVKQLIRRLLLAKDQALGHQTGIACWTTIDSLAEGHNTGCADIMAMPGGYYSPALPTHMFGGALFRACDAYVDLSLILPCMQPLSILVFSGLRGILSDETEGGWGKDSQVHPLLVDGRLVHVAGKYHPPRSLTREEYWAIPEDQDLNVNVFLYTAGANASVVHGVLEALRKACVENITYNNWASACASHHQRQ